jgi:hypothetical protein
MSDNAILKREIILQIFYTFGLYLTKPTLPSPFEHLRSAQYLLDKKLIFNTDKGKYSNNLWSASTKIENSLVKILIAELSEDQIEYALLIQLDALPPYILRLSTNQDDSGDLFFRFEDKWINAHTLFQAKLLVAVESLNEVLVVWDKLKDPSLLHQILIEYLKFNQ